MKQKRIYCDHNATTPVLQTIQNKYIEFLAKFGNPSSLYQLGREAKEALESVRYTCAEHINARPDQIIFCSSGTEANNQVIKQFIEIQVLENKPVHMLVSSIEHSSVLATVDYVSKFGIEVDVIPVDSNGLIIEEAYRNLFKENTKLVSIMFANNEIGTIQDLQKCSAIAHENGALFHSDAVQAFGKIDIDVQQLDIDFMSFSSHKIYAPKGAGALFVKDEHQCKPQLYGGLHERGLRASTENIPTLLAFEEAIKQINVAQFQQKTQAFTDQFKELFKESDFVLFNARQTRDALSNTVSISCPGCDGQALAMNCDLEGIDVSTGSACSVGSIEPSHVLNAIGLSDELNKSSLRISFGLTNTSEQVTKLYQILSSIVQRVKY